MPDYHALAYSYAQQTGLNPNIFVAQIQAESGFNPTAHSPAGAIGIAQFMPQTAAGLGLNPNDPVASLKVAASYDARNLKTYNGDYAKMLAAYNAGGGAVNTAVNQYGSDWLAHMPNETQAYVKNILGGTGANKSPLNQPNTQPNPSQQTTGSVILDQLKMWGEFIAVFVIALIIIILGFLLLSGKNAVQLAKKAVE